VWYDRLGVIMDAWTTLAASVICFRILHHDAMKNLGFVRACKVLRPRRWSTRSHSQYSQNNHCSLRCAIIANYAKRIALIGHPHEGRLRPQVTWLKARVLTAHNDACARYWTGGRHELWRGRDLSPNGLHFPQPHVFCVAPFIVQRTLLRALPLTKSVGISPLAGSVVA
jgi:hypothetical protein